MKTIKISKKTRELLRSYAEDGESVDDVINRLLDECGEEICKGVVTGSTNINLTEYTMIRVKTYKSYPHESYDSIISRALSKVR